MQTWQEVISDIKEEKIKVLGDSEEIALYLLIYLSKRKININNTPENSFKFTDRKFNEKTGKYEPLDIYILYDILDSPICKIQDIEDGLLCSYYNFVFDENNEKVIMVISQCDRSVVVFENIYMFPDRKSITIFSRNTGDSKHINF
jgi:hypothetical protein